MHRSGTSAIARGVQALGAELGDNLLETRFDNPTGYWEDKAIVELNDKVLGIIGKSWEDSGLIDDRVWSSGGMRLYAAELRHYVISHFQHCPVWAFKDPRTIRLLPIWKRVLSGIDVRVSYLLVLRNPLSVAASLYRRQAMPAERAHKLWLSYHFPTLALVANEALCVLDFDLFMNDPAGQYARLEHRLAMAPATNEARDVYLRAFLKHEMRHVYFSDTDLLHSPEVPSVIRDMYLCLRRLASSELTAGSPVFQAAWAGLEAAARAELAR
jgi:hypothetical protein